MAFYKAVIEGFYGKSWTWSEREDYATFLKAHDFNGYIYAPKSNRQLRSDWSSQLLPADKQSLLRLSQHYQDEGLDMGIGLSPMNIFTNYDATAKSALKNKLSELQGLGVSVLCLLFDDMPGAIQDLAKRQAEIIADVNAWSECDRLIVCPTYYSFDPVLEDVFGQMPAKYLEDFGNWVGSDIDIFWTGDRVISDSYPIASLEKITALLQRKPMIWDNYPVNDGRKTSRYLHLRPYSGRPAGLKDYTAGHIINPMNQAALSKLVLQTFPMIFQMGQEYSVDGAWNKVLAGLNCTDLAELLARDLDLFSISGLDAITSKQNKQLLSDYSSIDHPAATEICRWLEGQYEFDPDCLTE